MSISRPTKLILSLLALVAFSFIYIPLIVILINSFSTNRSLTWPPSGFTSEWWGRAVDSEGVRDALLTSVLVASAATAVALILGILVSLVIARYRFFGRESISLLIVLPISLPGIVTGIALNNVFTSYLGGLTFLTLVVAHATFCIVVVYNNALARLRRREPEQFDRLSFLPGEEMQVDYGEGAPTRVPGKESYRKPRLFVATLR